MPGKFYDALMQGKRAFSRVRSRNIVRDSAPPIKYLIHPGFFGKMHVDAKGHIQWNRKGRWE